MKRWIALGCFVAFCIFLAVVFVGRAKLGTLVESAINGYGPKLTGMEVRVRSVGISFFTGEILLVGFSLGNPDGFESSHAIWAASILVDLDAASLATDTIVIERVEVVQPDIIYEKKLGTDNFKALLERGGKTSGGKRSGGGTSGSKGDGKKILIRELLIRDGKVTLSASGLKGAGVSVLLPEIRLEDLGGGREGLAPEEVSRIILSAVYKNATTPAVRAALHKQLEELGIQLEAVGLDLKKELDSMKERVKGLFK